MKSVLTVFMAHYILNQSGLLAPMQENEAYMYTHYFVFASISFQFSARFWPTVGSANIGRFCRFNRLLHGQPHARVHGHVVGNRDRSTHNASNRIVPDLFRRGCIKPCVSANVGDQFRSIEQAICSRKCLAGSISPSTPAPSFLRFFVRGSLRIRSGDRVGRLEFPA